jgi:hypothetical protein
MHIYVYAANRFWDTYNCQSARVQRECELPKFLRRGKPLREHNERCRCSQSDGKSDAIRIILEQMWSPTIPPRKRPLPSLNPKLPQMMVKMLVH